MTINPDIRDQAYLFFVEEAPELLQAIETGLLTLRQERSPATIHAIMRSAHSLKGGAASVGLDAIKTIAHRLETIFKSLYSDSLAIDAQLESQLLQAYDCLRIPLTEQITQGSFDAALAIATAEPILSQLEAQCQEAIAETENFIPGSADLGVDMTASIFETDVAQGLMHLEAVLNYPQNYEVAGELRAQAEVLLGFAELMGLTGFAQIAQTVIDAIDQMPDQAIELTRLALSDFRMGRDAVLAGDAIGGQPSAALLSFIASGTASGTAFDIASGGAAQARQAGLSDLELLTEITENVSLNAEVDANSGFELFLENDFQQDFERQIELSRESNLASADANLEDTIAAQLSEAEIEAIVQQELLQDGLGNELDNSSLTEDPALLLDLLAEIDTSVSAAAQLSEGEDDAAFAEEIAQPPTLENRFELEAIFADLPSEVQFDSNTAIEQPIESNLSDFDIFQFDQFVDASDHEVAIELANGFDSIASTPAEILQKTSSENPTETQIEPIADHLAIDSHAKPALLPIAANLPAAGVTVKLPARPAAAVSPAVQSSTVRVDADRLERLNNLLGELTINRNGLALQTDQSRIALRELQNRFERLQSTIEQIRTLSDQMLIVPDYRISSNRRSLGQTNLRSALRESGISSFSALQEFDALEMDRYTGLYAATQTLLEEIAQVEEAVEDIVLFNRQSEQTLEQHRKMLSQMQDDLMRARMLPLGDVLNRFPRMIRDLSNSYDKPIDLLLSGTDLLIDKAVLEKLYEPLLHLLRNSFDHGIESASLRRDRGKPDSGRIEVQASSRGRQVVIEVRDDGQGLDFDRIRQRVLALGWLSETEAAAATEADLCEIIFAPGFSTATQVSELSGRGVGLDVVREQIQALKGSVTVRSIPAQGTTFILKLPLTLTITNLLICLVNARPIALRSDGIREILVPQPNQISETNRGSFLLWQEQQLPIYCASDLLTYRCLVPELPPSRVLAAVPAPSNWQSPVLILKQDQQFVALQVDRLVTEQEFVIKPFGSAIVPPDYTYGCTVLGDGMLVPVIDGQAFLETILTHSSTHPPIHSSTLPPLQSRTTTVLVVDDALTSRRTLALSLERAGYRVLQARDGQEAIEQLQQSRAIELIVCDIEMPNMNGFEFLTHRRKDADLARIPTVMLTSRSNDKHRWLAMQLGATDYFTKPYLEQEFLQAIAQLVGVEG